MDTRNTNRYRMLVVLLAFYESHRTDKTWTTIPALARAVADLGKATTSVGDILKETALPTGGSATRGVSAGKAACLEALVPAAYIIAAALHTYAVDNADADLAALTDVAESDLDKMNEPDLVAFCSKISTVASEMVDELKDYDVVQADLTALDKQIQAYAKSCPKPRQKVARNSATNQALPRLFQQARHTINKRIHKLMAKFKTTEPDFYNEYLTARKIIDQPATQGDNKAKAKAKSKDKSVTQLTDQSADSPATQPDGTPSGEKVA